ADVIARVGHDLTEAFAGEPWYEPTEALPVACDAGELTQDLQEFRRKCEAGRFVPGPVRCVTVMPRRFNDIVRKTGSKGAVPADALRELIRWNRASLPSGEPIHFTIDRQGGRVYYAAQIHDTCPDDWVHTKAESPERGYYWVNGRDREVTWTFTPRADSESLCVAWASMFSKYLREVCMRQFNRFWQQHIPDIRPTAGYPSDSWRFLELISPVAKRLGLKKANYWRSR